MKIANCPYNIADCPYIDKRCGEHAQCAKRKTVMTVVDFLKYELTNIYKKHSADFAVVLCNADIVELRFEGFITDAEEAELSEFNRKLYCQHK